MPLFLRGRETCWEGFNIFSQIGARPQIRFRLQDREGGKERGREGGEGGKKERKIDANKARQTSPFKGRLLCRYMESTSGSAFARHVFLYLENNNSKT